MSSTLGAAASLAYLPEVIGHDHADTQDQPEEAESEIDHFASTIANVERATD